MHRSTIGGSSDNWVVSRNRKFIASVNQPCRLSPLVDLPICSGGGILAPLGIEITQQHRAIAVLRLMLKDLSHGPVH